MQARHRLSLLFLSLTVGLIGSASAYPEYRVTVVAPANSAATAINGAGVVVGNYPFSATSTHAFLNRGSGYVDLGTMGGSASAAVAINDKGQVLGHWTTSSSQQRGFIYYRGTMRDIGVKPGWLTTYTDINYSGYITAYGAVADSFDGPHGFLRAPDGTFKDIGALPYENPMTYAYALNNNNRITGASGPLTFPDQPLRAITWSKGVMRDLGDFGMAPNYGMDINNCGQITGSASLSTGFRDRVAFLYRNGRMVDIDARPGIDGRSSQGTGINNRGHVVGSSDHLSGFVYRGRRMQSLNALIDPARGWDIVAPVAINDAGQIAATAYRNGVQYAVRLDLIRPLAEPVPSFEADD
jgi:probable HAF family extracellular repeat protein